LDDTGGTNRGALYVLFMNDDGTVSSLQKIANETGGGPTLGDGDRFGAAITALGDLDADGVTEIVVGASDDSAAGPIRGSVHVLFLNGFNTAPNFTSPNTASVDENTTTVMTVTAEDADLPPQSLTFSIVNGADQGMFSITPIGGLTFTTPPDFENPVDANGDNVYEVVVQVSDGESGTANQTISVTVTPENDSFPEFTTPTEVNIQENTTAVLDVVATDADLPAQTLTYSIVGGPDGSAFLITEAGVLSFSTAPDYEQPADANSDNVYEVTVEADDGESRTTQQTINVSVTP